MGMPLVLPRGLQASLSSLGPPPQPRPSDMAGDIGQTPPLRSQGPWASANLGLFLARTPDRGWNHAPSPPTRLTGRICRNHSMQEPLTFPVQFSSVQSLSHVQLFATPWTAARQASLSITNSWSLLKLMSITPVMPSNLILCRPLLLLPSIFPSIRLFSNESALRIRWPKYWNFSFSISPSKEHPGLISFRMDWLDLLAVQGTLKSLIQHHSSKALILWCSAFFIVQLSHSYMTT